MRISRCEGARVTWLAYRTSTWEVIVQDLGPKVGLGAPDPGSVLQGEPGSGGAFGVVALALGVSLRG